MGKATLKFHARSDALVPVPSKRPAIIGQAPRYVGRKLLPDGSLPAVEAPFVVDADSDAGRRLIKLVRRDGCLWPADRETARACGVDFVQVELTDGEWVPRRAPRKPAQPKTSEGAD